MVLSVLDTYTALTMLFFGPQFRTGLGKTPWLVRELWQPVSSGAWSAGDLCGDGSITRDYFYVSDLAEALIAGAEIGMNEQRIFNIGGGEEVSLIQLLRTIEEVVAKRAHVEYAPARRFDAPRIVLDTRLTRQERGWQPKVSPTDGLVQT